MLINLGDLSRSMGMIFMRDFMAIAKHMSCDDGQLLFKKGDATPHFYTLIQGEFRLTIGVKEQHVYTVRNPGDIFGDVFGDIFGGGRRGRSNVFRGADLRYDLNIELGQAVFGETMNITVPTLASCDSCDRSGAKPRTRPETYDTCGDAGQVRMQQGFYSIQQTCPNCRGTGQAIKGP